MADIVDLDVTRGAVEAALPADVDRSVASIILRARYQNLYSLMRDHLSEETYLR